MLLIEFTHWLSSDFLNLIKLPSVLTRLFQILCYMNVVYCSFNNIEIFKLLLKYSFRSPGSLGSP